MYLSWNHKIQNLATSPNPPYLLEHVCSPFTTTPNPQQLQLQTTTYLGHNSREPSGLTIHHCLPNPAPTVSQLLQHLSSLNDFNPPQNSSLPLQATSQPGTNLTLQQPITYTLPPDTSELHPSSQSSFTALSPPRTTDLTCNPSDEEVDSPIAPTQHSHLDNCTQGCLSLLMRQP